MGLVHHEAAVLDDRKHACLQKRAGAGRHVDDACHVQVLEQRGPKTSRLALLQELWHTTSAPAGWGCTSGDVEDVRVLLRADAGQARNGRVVHRRRYTYSPFLSSR